MTLVCKRCGEKMIEKKNGSKYCRNGCSTVTAQPRDGIQNFLVRTRGSANSLGGGYRAYTTKGDD